MSHDFSRVKRRRIDTMRARRVRSCAGLALACAMTVWLAEPTLADLRNTKHNFWYGNGDARDRAQPICVFCHTPSGVSEAVSNGARHEPLWQRARSWRNGFATYDDLGRPRFEELDSVGSQSFVCLSCHDSAQASDTTGIRSVDHPFGVPYRGSLARAAQEEGRSEDPAGRRSPRTREVAEYRPAVNGIVDGVPTWWIPAREGGILRTRLDLPLYARPDSEAPGAPMIECTTCHNPHAETRAFLRTQSLEITSFCQTCHIM